MKFLAFAIGLFALGFSASTPTRADFAVVQFDGGHCQIWWDSSDNPCGDTWKKIAVGLPDWSAASIALDNARAQNLCPYRVSLASLLRAARRVKRQRRESCAARSVSVKKTVAA
ncbi:MAG: hypothetical protein WB760_11320 [Xanthobacteraceae bacterium]